MSSFPTCLEKSVLRSKLTHARRAMDAVFALVPPGQWLARPIPERHRLVFYMGHVEAFDWNLIAFSLGLSSHQSSFDRLFAFGIDPQSGEGPQDEPSDWPSTEEIATYTRTVRRKINEVVEEVPPDLLHMAIEHRLMHAETFTYLLHNLPAPLPLRARGVSAPMPFHSGSMHVDTRVTIPAGMATLGRSRLAPEDCSIPFGWDNEFDEQSIFVPSFAIDRYKVTNARYLRFVEAGAKPPHFWRRRGHAWYWRTLTGEIPLPPEWPVYVTHREATAYADWSGGGLPTEAQFHRAAYGRPSGSEPQYPWGDTPPTPSHAHFHGGGRDPIGVAATPLGDSAFGVSQLVGNGWEWTSSVFAPFHGFRAHPCYPGYSTAFFDGDHYVLKGGSPVTDPCFFRRSFRNWYRPEYPYVYATFRCAEP